MVTPVQADKVMASNGNRASHTNPSTNNDQTKGQSPATESSTLTATQNRVEIDTARQLYQMENQRTDSSKPLIQTAEQARSVLGQIMQQMQDMPEQALASQANGSNSQISSLLKSHTVS